MNTHILPVKKELPFPSPNKSRRDQSPFCVCFVYPRRSTPYIVKGPSLDCEEWLINQNFPMVVHRLTYCLHTHTCWVSVYGLPQGVHAFLSQHGARNLSREYHFPVAVSPFKRKLWRLSVYDSQQASLPVFTKLMRYVPRKWINELDHFLPKEP